MFERDYLKSKPFAVFKITKYLSSKKEDFYRADQFKTKLFAGKKLKFI